MEPQPRQINGQLHSQASEGRALTDQQRPDGDNTMVLRLFSKTNAKSATGSKTENTAPDARIQRPALPAEDASVDELVSAVQATKVHKDRATLIRRIDDASAVRGIASNAGCLAPCADRLFELSTLEDALALATTAAARQELALGTHQATLRDAVLKAITSEEELNELEHASRSKNKACNRTARERLERLRAARHSASETTRLAAELASAAAALVNKADSELAHDSRASKSATATEEHVRARFDALAAKHTAAANQWAESAAILAEYAETAPALSPMPLPPEEVPPEVANKGPDFGILASAFIALQQQLESGESVSAIASNMQQAGDRWRAAISTATPDAHSIDQVANCTAIFEQVSKSEALLAKRADQIGQLATDEPTLSPQELAELPRKELAAAWLQVDKADALSKTIRKVTKGLSYPKSVPLPQVINELYARAEAAQALCSAGKARQKEIEDGFATEVIRLSAALDTGELKKAEAARGEARALQEALPAGAAQPLRKQFGALLANMQNLRDWQHFATDPKREELCQQMTELADNPLAPTDQAEQVKALRAQWNELGGKGPKDIAERFDAAATRAFEPCRVHYAELAEQRTANLAARRSILTQLETFVGDTNWDITDLNAARTILNSARTEWRNAFPVERGPNRALEKSFKRVTDELYEKLQTGWSDNLAAKEALVSTAEALLESEEPLAGRLEQAKRLQQQWKTAGPVPRGPDQKLWKRFRAACDTLFNTRDAERNQAQEKYAAQQTAAKARLLEFADLLETTAAADIDRSQLAAMKNDLDKIGKLDRSVQKQALELEGQFKAKLKSKAAIKKQLALTALERLDSMAAAAEIAGDPLPTEVLEGDKVFSTRAAGADNAHLDLVLEAESQAGIESPASDAQRRLELQVQWLNAGMNSGARKSSDALELASRWCGLSATKVSDALRERLFTAAKAMLG